MITSRRLGIMGGEQRLTMDAVHPQELVLDLLVDEELSPPFNAIEEKEPDCESSRHMFAESEDFELLESALNDKDFVHEKQRPGIL